MRKNTKIDGITVFNWERLEEHVTSGVYKKSIIPVGSKKIVVSYSTDIQIGKSSASQNLVSTLTVKITLSIYLCHIVEAQKYICIHLYIYKCSLYIMNISSYLCVVLGAGFESGILHQRSLRRDAYMA